MNINLLLQTDEVIGGYSISCSTPVFIAYGKTFEEVFRNTVMSLKLLEEGGKDNDNSILKRHILTLLL